MAHTYDARMTSDEHTAAQRVSAGQGAAPRTLIGLALAALVVLAGVALITVTGGFGALATSLLLAAALTWWATRRHRSTDGALSTWRRRHRQLWRATRWFVVAGALWNAVSFASYVVPDNGDTTSQRMATWGRDHGLGPVIDHLETWVYATPPSKAPAQDLSLAPVVTLAPTTTSPAISPPTTSPASTVPTAESVPATTVPPDPTPQPPVALTVPISPPLMGEGVWVPVAQAVGHDTMWATSIRPLGDVGGVVASMVVIDQTDLRSAMFNGSEEPGGSWVRGNRVPGELQPALLATMNGGFRLEHIKGGYMTEGRVVKPLRNGDATVAIDHDGTLSIGALGADIVDDGSWASLRQNLILIVDGGVSQVHRGLVEGVWWGADYGREVYVARSAICELPDGRIAYLMVAKVNADQLAQALINVGCVQAMQMDINGDWPQFDVYAHNLDGSLDPYFVDQRMSGNTHRSLEGSTKEFFAFFDDTLVPSPSILDT